MMELRAGAVRLLHILAIVSRHAGAHCLAMLGRRQPPLVRLLRLEPLSGPVRFRMTLEELGGSFIKLGQMLALQPDIIPLEYCNELFTLLDRVSPFAYEDVEGAFLEELGRAPHDLFDTFDRRPLATASVGQVHVATLGRRKLAVKVQRPNVERDFAGDLRLITIVTTVIRRLRIARLYWVLDPLDEFVAWTHEELDYRIEARYMAELHRNARDNPRERIPAVLWEYTTRRTLVADFLDGDTVLSYLRMREAGDGMLRQRMSAAGIVPHQVSRNIIDNFLGDVFQHGIFHADLHPANLLIMSGNVVGYIDFGITGAISVRARRNLVGLTLAYTRADLDGMCDAFLRVSTKGTAADPGRFRVGLRTLARSWYGHGRRQPHKTFTQVMLDMVQLSRTTDIWPEREVIKYIRSAIAIDGLITRFEPSFNVSEYLESVCARWLKWQRYESVFRLETFVDGLAAMGCLTRDAASRTADLLQRLADSDLTSNPDTCPQERANRRQGRRMLGFAAAACALSLLMGITQGPARFGMNLFTVEAIAVGFAITAAVRLMMNVEKVG
jgi:ubiquinone biosynthesis protein